VLGGQSQVLARMQELAAWATRQAQVRGAGCGGECVDGCRGMLIGDRAPPAREWRAASWPDQGGGAWC
jgi:hypothetical protein